MDLVIKSVFSVRYHIVPSGRAHGYLLCVFTVVLELWERSVNQ